MKKTALFCVITPLSCLANAEPPATSGIVTRGGYPSAYWFVDDSSGMGLAVGADIVQFCSGTEDFGFHSFADENIQEGLRLSTIEKADDQVRSVWPFTEFDCERFLTELPLATGEARFRGHDNDFFGLRYCDIKNNMSAWGYSIEVTALK
jgi:hypothetical protein